MFLFLRSFVAGWHLTSDSCLITRCSCTKSIYRSLIVALKLTAGLWLLASSTTLRISIGAPTWIETFESCRNWNELPIWPSLWIEKVGSAQSQLKVWTQKNCFKKEKTHLAWSRRNTSAGLPRPSVVASCKLRNGVAFQSLRSKHWEGRTEGGRERERDMHDKQGSGVNRSRLLCKGS